MGAGPVNPNVGDVGSPPIPQAREWLARYGGGHGPVVNLSQAAPGGPPPPEFLERLAAAAASPALSAYGPILGEPALREAYAADVSARYGGEVSASEVAVTGGCNMAFFAAALALAGPGDAVLLPTPWYFNHQMALAMLGVEARPLTCRPENGFVPDPEEAAALLDGRVRAVVLVTPNNPTGAVYPPETVARFAALCRDRGIRLILDETYRDFLPAGVERPHGLLESPSWRATVVQLYSFSKSYCIPGHRTGAIVAGEALVGQVAKVLDTVQICPARPAQAVLPWAVPALAGWREENRREILRRAERFREAVANTGWRIDAIGAYFAYLRHPFGGTPAAAVARALAEERGVLALPGSFFGPGQEGHLRVAFANVTAEVIGGLPERLRGVEVG